MAEAAVSSAVELLGNLLIQEIKFLRGVKGQVELLKGELKAMQSFLKDANKKQAQDETVRNWISDIRAAARDAEDIIDIFLIKVESARSRKLLERWSSFAKRVFQRYRIGREIESLRDRLAAIDERRRRYRIEGSGDTAADLARSSEVALRRRLSPWQNVEHLVGVEEDVKKLLRNSILNEENKGLSFALVEGMGGIGKSTLARAVFDHREVAGGGFECRGWVVVSSEFNVKETIKQVIFKVQKCGEDEKKMLEKFQKLEETMKDEQFLIDELEQLLCEQLEGKTYFIVLDDVWEKKHLESLIRAFPNQQGKRSRVLVTSRNKIMTRSRNQYVHEMKLLDADEGWELFLNCAVIDGKCPAELEAIGRRILEKCHGLPLAISVAGGLVVETEAKSGWEEVVAQIESLLGGDESKVSPILELSYQYLPPHLKSCFLFLSFFKEDSIIETTRLINIWTTHGLIPKQGNEDAIARGHLNELINRSMVQVEALAIDGRVESCRLHDLLREVCIRRAKEEIGLEILKRDDEASSSSSSSDIKPRHRVVYGWWNLQTSSSEEDRNKHLRSVFLVNASSDSTLLITNISTNRYWKSFELLKTLDLDGVQFRKLPDFFRSLVGLKSLRIQSHPLPFRHNELQLPAWFDELKSLEVLDAASEILEFPSVALKMERLRRFHAYFVWGGALNINKWENIETLKGIRPRDLSSTSSTFRIRELSVYVNRMEQDTEVRKTRALMDKMENLEELQLLSALPHNVNSNLIPHHLHSLTKLELHCGWMLTCPAATLLPPNLSHLALMGCLMAEEDPMPELGKLQKLKYLKLTATGYSREEDWKIKVFSVSGEGFPCLEALYLGKMNLMRGIHVEEGGMPHLKKLRIYRCPNFKTKNLPEHVIKSVVLES